MTGEPATARRTRLWLVWRSGPLAGARYLLPEGSTRIGRSPDNELVLQGPDLALVSLHHAEISRDSAGVKIRDLGSTNGTFVNGEAITEADLRAPATIRIGAQGPELAFIEEETVPAELGQTVEIRAGDLPLSQPGAAGEHEVMLSEAVERARRVRFEGFAGQTMVIMRDTLNRALQRTRRRLRFIIYALAAALATTAALGAWKISELRREKASIDRRIREIESRLQEASGPDEKTDSLIDQLSVYQDQARSLENSLFYRVSVRDRGDFLTNEIRMLMAEFGAEVYSIPPEFAERVRYYVREYQGPNRPIMVRGLNQGRPKFDIIRRVLEEEQLPPDLGYIPLVESALAQDQSSAAGAAGLWQFTPATARAYGLRVDHAVDERLDIVKATRASCRYLRKLILEFGAGSSVMLALAAYNLGPTKVKQAVMKAVRDPIKQRNFWYLYRTRALPPETREYVPKVFAAIIIGRNPERFGF